MKKLRLCGWAVIFTATFLLAACASHDPRVATSDAMSGPDTTMSQQENQMHEDSAIVVSQDWLDERERAVEQREFDLERRENALVIQQAWLDEREMRLARGTIDPTKQEDMLTYKQAWLDERETHVGIKASQPGSTVKLAGADYNFTPSPGTIMSQHGDQVYEDSAVVVSQDWLDERERAVEQREFDLERRENALVIQQAWLNERETRLAQSVPDLTEQKEILAFKEAWLDEREMLVEKMENRSTSSVEGLTGSVKLAGADSSLASTDSSPTRSVGGRCYARVIYPAEYKTVAVVKPIEIPEGENLPTLYQTVTEKVKVTDEQRRWEEIMCEDRMTECRIIEVQRALYRGGYDPGPIDGIVGKQTMAAVNAFQKDFNLTVANYLTVETVKALDANF